MPVPAAPVRRYRPSASPAMTEAQKLRRLEIESAFVRDDIADVTRKIDRYTRWQEEQIRQHSPTERERYSRSTSLAARDLALESGVSFEQALATVRGQPGKYSRQIDRYGRELDELRAKVQADLDAAGRGGQPPRGGPRPDDDFQPGRQTVNQAQYPSPFGIDGQPLNHEQRKANATKAQKICERARCKGVWMSYEEALERVLRGKGFDDD